jgi:hypothetical protein
MQRYQGLAGRARILLAQLRAWIAGHPDIRPGSLAWETQREVEKLSAIVNDRLTRLRTTPLDDAARSELEQELSEYEQQLADYEAALASIADEAGRGYVAAASSGVPRRAQAAPTPELVLPTDRNPALFNTAPNPGELFLDRSGANTGAITRRTVADANRSSPNSNSRNGIFVQGPNGTFIRYLPLEYPAGRTRFQSARNARAQGIVALIDTSYLDQNLGVEASGHIANRLTDQDRGHLLANILGGANIRENLFPLWYFRNRGFMSQMEVALENDIRTHGRRVWIQVDTIYGPRGVPLGLVVRVDDANGTNPPDPLSTTASVHWFPNYDVLGN